MPRALWWSYQGGAGSYGRGTPVPRTELINLIEGEASSCLKRIDACITQLQAQGPSRACNESKGEEKQSVNPREAHARLLEGIARFGSVTCDAFDLSKRL